MRTRWTGCGTALVTPFTRDGAIDEPAIRRLARRQIDAGIHFLVPCGTTGESPTLSRGERQRVVELVAAEAADAGTAATGAAATGAAATGAAARSAAGRGADSVPVLAGAGGYDTREVIEAVHDMERAGAHGILSVTPYYNKPSQEGLFQHYRAIADSTTLPIVIYNVPGRTGCNVEPATLVRLAAITNIVAVKEASGSIMQIADVCARVPPDFLVLSGDDALTLPVMALGGQGVISVAGNEVPGEMSRMVEAVERGDWRAARAGHARLWPLMTVNFVESNPIPVKAAMATMGLLEEVYRLPMVPPRDESRPRIEQVLRDLDLLARVPSSTGARR